MGVDVTPELPHVALKLVKSGFATQAFAEIRTHSILGRHPHLSDLLEAFPYGGQICLAFALHGRELTRAIPAAGFPIAEAKAIARDLLEGLTVMHDAGLIHTDIKPDNVLYDSDRRIAKLADLGLASTRLVDGDTVASCDYTPPEAILGAPMGSPIDLWSLACTLYQVLTGSLLFDPLSVCQEKYDEFDQMASGGDPDVCGGATEFHAGALIAQKYRLETALGTSRFGEVWQAVPIHHEPVPPPPILPGVGMHPVTSEELPKGNRWNLYEVTLAYEHLLQMVQLLGLVPPALLQGKWRELFCEADGSLRFDDHIQVTPLFERLAAKMPEAEARAAAGFLGPLLQFDPQQRPTVREVLASSWLG